MEPWGLQPKKFQTSVAVPPAPVQVPSQRPLALSVAAVANDKGDIKMILGAVHRSPGICFTAEENPGNPQVPFQWTVLASAAPSLRVSWTP